jgi:hypothetical protein
MTKPGFDSTTFFGITSGGIVSHIGGSDSIAKLPCRSRILRDATVQ